MNVNEQIIVNFPIMHLELAPAGIPDTVRFFDPGIGTVKDQGAGRYFRSTDLAFQDAQARAFLEDSLRFGSQFKHTADMAYFQAGSMNNFFSGSMQEIKSELLSPGDKENRRKATRIADAQLVLLLEFHLEQRMIELDSLGRSIDTSVRHFEKNLGLEKDSSIPVGVPAVSASRVADSRAEFSPAWRRLLVPFLYFLPDNACILLTDSVIISECIEQGMRTTPCREQHLSALFPGWTPPEGVVSSQGNITGQELIGWVQGNGIDEVANKSFSIVTMLFSD